MNPERRQAIEELFEEALSQPLERRFAWLVSACGDDDELRRDVVALLAAHDRSSGLLENDAARAAAAIVEREATLEQIGPYRIDDVLGRGGMGVVYLAERVDGQFQRRVAIKLIRGSPDVGELRRRFEIERQVLAALQHPNIAALLDGGITADGDPYLVMEYVDGRPIDEYCQRNGLSVEERLRLFSTAARAVHHAHRNLVVHRDIKPSNIFVTVDGVVKLLDFGIAKILDPSLYGQTGTVTQTGVRLMTPAYASPEQVTGGPITTATDIYGLGVVLYELLAERRPFGLDGLSAGERERVICEVEPSRPSSAVLEDPEPPPDVEDSPELDNVEVNVTSYVPAIDAATRMAWKNRARRLRRRLRGDLDRIVLMALRKEPERRYASALQLAEDIERHLEGRPVIARADSPAYRARKFISRHRWAVVAAAAVLLSLVGGSLATAWQARRAARQAEIAAQERDRARGEAQKAARVASVMVDLFRLSDPNETLGDTITARQVLDRGTERIEREFRDQPEVQAELMLEVARVYGNIGLLERSESLIRRALEIREELFGPEALETSESLAQLGHVLAARGQRTEAIAQLQRAIAIRERALDRPDTLLARARADLAWEVRAIGRYDEAAALFRRALETQIAVLGEESPQVALTMLGLASAYHDAGSLDDAETLLERALARVDTSGVQAHPFAATALLNIGMIRRLKEDYRSALPLVESAFAMRNDLYEPGHPLVIEAAKEWGALLNYLGRYAEAQAVLGGALERASRVLSERHDDVITLREALAINLTATGHYAEALARHDTSLTVKRAVHAEGHAAILVTLARMGEAYLGAGRLEEASEHYRRVLDATSPGSVYRLIALRGLARIATLQGRHAEAERAFEEALDIAAEKLRPEHRYTLAVQRAHAALLIETGRADRAITELEGVLAAERAKFDEPHPDIGHTLHYLGEAHLRSGDPVAAERFFRAALTNYGPLPETHWQIGDATHLLGTALAAQGQTAAAQPLLEDGRRIVHDHVGPESWQATRARESKQ